MAHPIVAGPSLSDSCCRDLIDVTLPLVDANSKSVHIVAVAVANVEERVDDRVLTADSLTV